MNREGGLNCGPITTVAIKDVDIKTWTDVKTVKKKFCGITYKTIKTERYEYHVGFRIDNSPENTGFFQAGDTIQITCMPGLQLDVVGTNEDYVLTQNLEGQTMPYHDYVRKDSESAFLVGRSFKE